MKHIIVSIGVIAFFLSILVSGSWAGDLDRIAEGLKEALNVGIKEAVKKVAIEDGFYKNNDIKIPMPKDLKAAEEFLDKLGLKGYSEKLVKKMNRAAEKAAPQAVDNFLKVIREMKIEDAAKLLSGDKNAATLYLKEKTTESLEKAFYPVIKETMEQINAIKTYNDFVDKYSSNPLLQGVNLDINKYVTEKSIEGLILMVEREEQKIREDPAARINDLLKDVFGNLFK